MGERGNVFVKEPGEDDDTGVWLYTHWGCYELPGTLADALHRGKSRWGDAPYLTRIIFNSMVSGDEMGTTGFGISARMGDNNYPILVVDDVAGTVSVGSEVLAYQEFIDHVRKHGRTFEDCGWED